MHDPGGAGRLVPDAAEAMSRAGVGGGVTTEALPTLQTFLLDARHPQWETGVNEVVELRKSREHTHTHAHARTHAR